MNYHLLAREAQPVGAGLYDVVREKGNSNLLAAYTQFTARPSASVTLNVGVNAQFFTLNNSYAIEPRFHFRHQLSPTHAWALSYGLHSRLERLNYYFVENSRGERSNHGLDFTKAHHFVLGYEWQVSPFARLQVEAYYQHLFDVPVIADSSFSLLNQLGDQLFSGPLENTGLGRNYGLELTFNRRLSEGYYYMATASVFRSRYRGGDRVWRDTRYNRNYALNFLVGKEWGMGRNKQNVLGVNARVGYQGGDRYSPVRTVASIAQQAVVYDETAAFSLQYPAAFTAHFTASYRINKKKTSHEIALKILNLTQYEEYVGHRYNYQAHQVDVQREPVIIPNLSYRIDF